MPLLKPPLGAQLRRDHPLAAGLVGAWLCNEGSGGTVQDYSGNGNTGTLTNMDPSTDWVPGPDGYCLDFDGSNDYINVPSHPALDNLSECSILVACTPMISGGSAFLVCKYSSSYEYALYISAPTWKLIFYTASTGYTPAAMPDCRTGSQVLGVAAGAGYCQLYRDGIGYAASSVPASLAIGTRALAIGRQGDMAAYQFPGTIGVVSIWNRILPPDAFAAVSADPYALFRERRRWWMFGQTAGGISVPWHLLQGRAA